MNKHKSMKQHEAATLHFLKQSSKFFYHSVSMQTKCSMKPASVANRHFFYLLMTSTTTLSLYQPQKRRLNMVYTH